MYDLSMDPNLLCHTCGSAIQSTFYFCPNCGKKLKDPPVSTTIPRQIVLYLVAFFLPPSGLFTGIKYLRQNGDKPKYIGTVLIVLTIVSIGISIYTGILFYNKMMATVNSQLGGQSAPAAQDPEYLKNLGL